jgi:hypothetical protein
MLLPTATTGSSGKMLSRTTPPQETPTETNPGQEFWRKFEDFLLTHQTTKTVESRLTYAQKFGYIMLSGDSNASELLTLPLDKRLHAMKSLASLSKFLGKYDEWKKIRERYQLKWSKGDSLEFFEKMYENEENYDVMVKWLRQTVQIVSKNYAKVLLFDTITGLRPAEACHSISLIHSTKMLDQKQGYYNKERMTLEHFRFPEIFIRRTKKAYISIVTDRVLEIARLAEKRLEYQQLRVWLHKRGYETHMGYCRKIFATFMRQKAGVESEIIDILQGRTPSSVFARHYFRPSGLDFREKVLRGLEELERDVWFEL